MTDSELKLLYVESCFAVLNRTPPIKEGKIDLIKSMGLLAAFALMDAIPLFADWCSEATGEQIQTWCPQADLSLYKAMHPKVSEAG